MQFFHGVDRRRGVSLRGNSMKPEDRRELLERARGERAERNRKREFMDAVGVVQRVFRRWEGIWRAVEGERVWMEATKVGVEGGCDMTRMYFIMTRGGLWSKNLAWTRLHSSRDRDHLWMFQAWVSTRSDEMVKSSMAGGMAFPILSVWAARMAGGRKEEEQGIGRVLELVLGLEMQTAQSVFGNTNSSKLFAVSRLALTEVDMSTELREKIFHVCCLGLIYSRDPNAAQRLVDELFSLHISRLGLSKAYVWPSGFRERLFKDLRVNEMRKRSIWELENQFCMLIRASSGICKNDPQSTWVGLANVFSDIIKQLPFRQGDDDEEDNDGNSDEDIDQAGSEDLVRLTRNRAVELISVLFSDGGIRELLEICLDSIVHSRPESESLGTLLNWLTLLNRNLELQLLTSINFDSGEKKHILWRTWNACLTNSIELETVPDPTTDSLDLTTRANLLEVFCRSLTVTLIVQDDDDMRERGIPFPIHVARGVVKVLTECLYHIVWEPSSIIRVPDSLVRSIASALTRLKILDERKAFSDSESFWSPHNHPFSTNHFVDMAAEGGSKLTQDTGRTPMEFSRKGTSTSAIEILRLHPFMVPFESRAKIFSTYLQQEERDPFGWLRVVIRRNYLFEDGFSGLNHLKSNLQRRIQILFVDEYGIEEAGVDGGGVFKEFMHEFMTIAFSSKYGLWIETAEGQVYPNPGSEMASHDHLEQLQFLGRMLGKAIREGVHVRLPLATFFLNRLLGRYNSFEDLAKLDFEMYKSLKYVKTCKAEEVENLGLVFSLIERDFGEVKEVDLIPNGRNMPVTVRNRIEYVRRFANYKLNRRIKRQCDAFLEGFSDLIHPNWIRIFSLHELQELISGKEGDIDVDDWRRHAAYSGGYTDSHPTIEWFWQAINEFSPDQQAALLRFVSSSPRAPLLGFGSMYPSFCIHRVDGEMRLPTASTCMNLLKLPEYSSLELLRQKLLVSISSNTGFGYS